MTPYKVCPSCGQRCVIHMPACGRCGHAFRTAPPNQTQFFNAPPAPATSFVDWDDRPQPQAWLILFMWGLNIAGVLLFPTYGIGLAILLDLPAFGIGILLACSRNETDRINGWVKIGLEIAGAVGAALWWLVVMPQAHPYGY